MHCSLNFHLQKRICCKIDHSWKLQKCLITRCLLFLKTHFEIIVSKGNKISKRPSISFSSWSQCHKLQRKITPCLNLYRKFKWGEIFCCGFWHRLENENEVEDIFKILLPLKAAKSQKMWFFLVNQSRWISL